MDLKTIATGILLILFALVVSVNAIDLRTSDDSISISSTEGSVFVYVKNTASEEKDLYLSVDGHRLNAYADQFDQTIRAGSTGGATIHISAPDCFRGSESVSIYAQLCSSTSCETASKKVIVYVEPARQCSTYIEGYASRTQFISGYSCGTTGCYLVDNIAPKESRLVYSSEFDPTSYKLRMTGGDSCASISRGEIGSVRLTIANRGAAGNFDIDVISDSNVQAFPSRDGLSLQRSDSQEITVDIKPEAEASAGRIFVTVQVLHLDELIAEKDVCVDLQDEFKSSFIAPSKASARTSKDMTIQLEVANEGTTSQHYRISALNSEIQNEISVLPREFILRAGASKMVDVLVKTSKISSGTYELQFEAVSEDASESAYTILTVANDVVADQEDAVAVTANQEQTDNVLKVFTTIKNAENFALTDLDVEVTGLPTDWKVSEISPITIAANSEKKVNFEITMASEAEATPKLVISKDGKVLATETLPKISGKAGGFTGMFSLNSGNAVLGAVILVVILLFFMVGRRGDEPSSGHHMESIKHEIQHGGSHGSSHGGH
ncbi:MAG: hypothetical protein ABIG96_04255 [Candidatus Micrarchaeota archaeon]